MQTNLGRCHYGRDDDAIMIGARADGAGWIGVCEQHRAEAERDGYVLHELTVVDDGAPAEREPRRPTPPPTDDEPAHEPSVGLDILDDPYPVAAGDSPLR